MKIRVGDFKIDTSTLVEFRWDGKLPKLIIHEKFEKPLRWIVWTIATISFTTIFISIENYKISVAIGLLLFLLSFIFDRAIVKYTTIVVQPFAEFTVEYEQWKNVMTVSKPDKNHVNFIGFVYGDANYGKKFFNYIKSWNKNNADDSEGNIILSIVEEDNGSFTFYLYANPDRKHIGDLLDKNAAKVYIDKTKEDKVQEGLIVQMCYWKTIKYTNSSHMSDFLRNQPFTERLAFFPVIRNEKGYAIDIESQIILNGYKYSKRSNLSKACIENQLTKNDS